MSYHPKKLAPGTPTAKWIEDNKLVNPATAGQYASGISFLIETYGIDRLLVEDICVIRDLYHCGKSYCWRRTWNRKLQETLIKYQNSPKETPVVGGATA